MTSLVLNLEGILIFFNQIHYVFNNLLRKIVITSITLLIAASFATAQNEAADTTKQVIDPYPLTEITAKINETTTLTGQINDFYSNRQDLDDVQSDFYLLDSALKVVLSKVDTSTISQAEVKGLSGELSAFNSRIEELLQKLNDRTSKLMHLETK